MHLVLLILLILFCIAFLARAPITPANPYPWLADVIGALLLIGVTLVLLRIVPA